MPKYVKDLKVSRQMLGSILCQEIREFEQETGLLVEGIKITRNKEVMGDPIESVAVRVEFPD